jgi:hypothetical protein
MKWMAPLALICLVTLAVGPAFAEMYYWTDEMGIRHYSNSPPPPGTQGIGTASEVQYDAEADRLRTESEVRAAEKIREAGKIKETEALEKKAEESQAAEDEKRRRLEDEQRELEKKLYGIRRYAHGDWARKAIQRARQINQQITELEKSGGNEAQIAELKDEKRRIAEVFYRQSRRWRHGGEADLKQHQRIQEELDEMDEEELDKMDKEK